MDTNFALPDTKRALGIVALGAVAWIIAGLYYGSGISEQFMVGLLLIAIGMATSAWSLTRTRWLPPTGFAIALVGIILFLGNGLGRPDSLARGGSHTFALALILMGAASATSPAGNVTLFRLGAAAGVIASLLWVVADLDGGAAWEPGNLLALGGTTWAALRAKAGI